jgi:hypothetical protein
LCIEAKNIPNKSHREKWNIGRHENIFKFLYSTMTKVSWAHSKLGLSIFLLFMRLFSFIRGDYWEYTVIANWLNIMLCIWEEVDLNLDTGAGVRWQRTIFIWGWKQIQLMKCCVLLEC